MWDWITESEVDWVTQNEAYEFLLNADGNHYPRGTIDIKIEIDNRRLVLDLWPSVAYSADSALILKEWWVATQSRRLGRVGQDLFQPLDIDTFARIYDERRIHAVPRRFKSLAPMLLLIYNDT